MITFDRFQQNLVSLYFPSFAENQLLLTHYFFPILLKTQKRKSLNTTHILKLYSFIHSLFITLYHTLSLYRILFFLEKTFFRILYTSILFFACELLLTVCYRFVIENCVRKISPILKIHQKSQIIKTN